MGTFAKWKTNELPGNLSMSIYARTAAKRQEGHTECEGIRNHLPHSEQLDWETNLWETIPWWICYRTSIRWKQKERSCLSEKRRSYHSNRRDLRGQVVVRWNVERKMDAG